MALSQSEIYSLAKSVGLSDSRAKVAAAVAMAESGGNPNAHNDVPPDDSWGLWQINMIGSMGPARRAQFGLSSNSQLTDPKTNAKAMKAISFGGGNFNPWSTYTNGSYRKWLSNDVKDDGSGKSHIPIIGGAIDSAQDTAHALSTIASVTGKSAVWLSDVKNWERIAFVVVGSVIGIVGVFMIVQQTGPGKAATKLAATVATKGAIK